MRPTELIALLLQIRAWQPDICKSWLTAFVVGDKIDVKKELLFSIIYEYEITMVVFRAEDIFTNGTIKNDV